MLILHQFNHATLHERVGPPGPATKQNENHNIPIFAYIYTHSIAHALVVLLQLALVSDGIHTFQSAQVEIVLSVIVKLMCVWCCGEMYIAEQVPRYTLWATYALQTIQILHLRVCSRNFSTNNKHTIYVTVT